jgi:hypothetical protein
VGWYWAAVKLAQLLAINQPCDFSTSAHYLLFKTENRIDFTTTPHDAYGMPLPDSVLSDDELA